MKKLFYYFSFCCSVAAAINVTIPPGYQDKISTLIVNAQTGKTIYSYNSSTPRLVASNIKLFTALIGLQQLHPDFHWHTQMTYSGEINDGVLKGNLYLIGGGDPTLDDKAVYLILSQLKRLGITQVNGNVIIDNHIFNHQLTYSMLKTEHYDSDTSLPYGFLVDGNFSSFTLNTQGSIPTITSNLYHYNVVNQLKLDHKLNECGDVTNLVDVSYSNKTITFSGDVAPSCNGKILTYNMLPYQDYTTMVLERILDDLSIKITGKFGFANIPDHTTLAYDYASASLAQILITMNQFSVNLIAEAVLLSLGAYTTTNDDTYTQAKQVYTNFLEKNNLLNSKFKLENGAGLSRTEYMTADNIAHLLWIANHSPLQANFQATLPNAGVDGTLQHRFSNYGNRVQFKTGTLNDTSAYSGYFYAKNGTKYIVVIIANNIDTSDITTMTTFNNWINRNVLSKLN